MFTELKIPAGRRPMTAGESRISAIVGLILTLLLLVAIFEEFSPQKLSVVFYILFWIPMLVIHELGHALAAKALDWQVREIVIGFGRTLWRARIGETRIRIKLVPLEGYVLPAPASPHRVRLKSALIYAAGPGAEFLLLGLMLLVFGTDTVFNDSDDPGLIALKTLAVVIIIGGGFNLLPFRTEGAASDGLGILSSPFLSDEAIEMRLITFEAREIGRLLESGRFDEALAEIARLQSRFTSNQWLMLAHSSALSGSGQVEAARDFVRSKLNDAGLRDEARREWLKMQARIELDADEPDYLVLDLALQKAFAIAPNATDLLAIKGASMVARHRCEEGGDMLAHAWRSNDGLADDAMLLAWLAIAAHRVGNAGARDHFRDAFEKTSHSAVLRSIIDRWVQI